MNVTMTTDTPCCLSGMKSDCCVRSDPCLGPEQTAVLNFSWSCDPRACPSSLSAEKKPNVMFVLTQHGGHMGFFEGAVLLPHPLTWMDKVIVEFTNSVCSWEDDLPACQNQQNRRSAGRHSSLLHSGDVTETQV